MTDLSYTNKDGVNLYEGFDNGFNYHKDGAEGEGYAHGGYPEITGETSNLPDTSYKTGDDVDFFDNGNVWEQPSVNPGPEPGPEAVNLKVLREYEEEWAEIDLTADTVASVNINDISEGHLISGEVRFYSDQKVVVVYDDGTEIETTDYTLTPVVGDEVTYTEYDVNGTLTASGITKNILIYVESPK